MKKILISATLLLIINIAFAQIPGNIGYNSYQSSNKNFGFKGGFNFSNIHGDDVEDTKSKAGFIAGLFYEIPRTEQFSIQPEILFSMKGWKRKYTFYGYDENNNYVETNTEYSQNLNYLEIPVLGIIKLDKFNNIIPALYFGPCFGFNVSSTYRIEGNPSRDNSTDTGSIEGITVFEFSIIPGMMLEINEQFVFDCRYTIGLTEINEWEIKNSVLSFMIGYKL